MTDLIVNTILLLLCSGITFLTSWKQYRLKKELTRIEEQLDWQQLPSQHILLDYPTRELAAITQRINLLLEEKRQIEVATKKQTAQLKNEIAEISHDIRTPLTAIIGYLQLLKRTELAETQQESLVIALKKANELEHLLTAFFELSTVTINEEEQQLSSVNMSAIISELLLANYVNFSAKGMKLYYDEPATDILVIGNLKLIQRVLENLMSNCLKYSAGDVAVALIDKEQVSLVIGNPILAQDKLEISQLFERFYRGNPTTPEAGMGIGLTIAKLLMERMNGSISGRATANYFEIVVTFQKE